MESYVIHSSTRFVRENFCIQHKLVRNLVVLEKTQVILGAHLLRFSCDVKMKAGRTAITLIVGVLREGANG